MVSELSCCSSSPPAHLQSMQHWQQLLHLLYNLAKRPSVAKIRQAICTQISQPFLPSPAGVSPFFQSSSVLASSWSSLTKSLGPGILQILYLKIAFQSKFLLFAAAVVIDVLTRVTKSSGFLSASSSCSRFYIFKILILLFFSIFLQFV